jgi:hypothetical protein
MLFEVYQEFKYGLCNGLTTMWQTMTYQLYFMWIQNCILQWCSKWWSNHFKWGFHIMWHNKQVNAQNLDNHVKSLFGVTTFMGLNVGNRWNMKIWMKIHSFIPNVHIHPRKRNTILDFVTIQWFHPLKKGFF